MDCTEMEKLIKLVEKSSLKELYYKTEAEEIRLVRQEAGIPMAVAPVVPVMQAAPAAMPAASASSAPPETAGEEAGLYRVRSPYVGTVNLNGEDGSAYVAVGDTVTKGQLLCRVEAMKMLSDLVSPVAGTVRKVLVADGDLVEFDAGLFDIEEA